ncbi:MAG: hypothetical protein ACFB0G_11380 [Leptolyngbyaceae cyanobacterium]
MSKTLQEAAKSGDIKALEALMNKSFASKGVTVRVTNSGSLLRVSLRGKTAPPQGMDALVKKGLTTIKPQGFDKVLVIAITVGKGENWRDEWEIGTSQAAKAVATSKPVASSSSEPKTSKSKRWYLSGSALFGFAITAVVALALLGEAVKGLGEIFDNGSGHLEAALDYATEAQNMANTADSEREWDRVARTWESAVEELEQVPTGSKLYEEASAKADEFRQQGLDATSKAQTAEFEAGQNSRDALQAFKGEIQKIDPNGVYIADAKLSDFGGDGDLVIVTVAPAWHSQPKPSREDVATSLFKLWLVARQQSGGSTDDTYMRLENASGTEVGGYGPLKGIYIKD